MHLLHHPWMVAGYVGGLFDVFAQVMKHEGHWEGVIHDLGGGFRPVDRQLESTLADGEGTIAVIVYDRLVNRPGSRFSSQRPEKTLAVFGGVVVQLDVQHLRQGGDDIIEQDRRWTPARFDFFGPTDEERHTLSALLQSRLPAAERSVRVVAIDGGVAPDPPGSIPLGARLRSVLPRPSCYNNRPDRSTIC